MRILVTGGSGFIGSHLVDRLIEEGNEVVVIDNLITGLNYKNSRAKYIAADLRDSKSAIDNIKNFDIIFHLASNYSVIKSTEDPRFDFENNFLLTFNVLEAMRKNNLNKIVFTSTSAVYGRQQIFPTKENVILGKLPISNYGASKLSSEIYIHSFADLYGIQGLILRLANILGPRSNHGIVPDTVKKIKVNDNEIVVFGDGKQKKSYIHISDCIDAMIIASEKFRGFDVFNIGNDDWISVTEIISIVCNTMGVNPKIIYSGGVGGWAGDVPEFLLDISKIKSIGWAPRMSIKEAIVDTVNWLKRNDT